jgi:predicted nucleic acid-binding Zn ribbon protein
MAREPAPDRNTQRRAAVRMALVLAAIVVAIYVWAIVSRVQ